MTPPKSKTKKNTAEDVALKMLQKLAKTLKAELKQEYLEGTQAEAKIRQEVAAVSAKIEAITNQVKKQKALSKKRKKEISQWKNWFETLTDLDTSEEQRQLQNEISWRARDIGNAEATIAALYGQRMPLETELEMKKARLSAIENGVYDRPPEQDPRYLALLKQIEGKKQKPSA